MEKSINIADFDQNLAIHSETSKTFSIFFFGNKPNRIEKKIGILDNLLNPKRKKVKLCKPNTLIR